jgi:sulfoxide reductase heme-binding subunit YedZ
LAITTGHWTIRFLIITLALTPIRFLFNLPLAVRLRRMLGLFTWFYAILHFLVFLIFLLQLEWGDLGTEIAERPYITVGFTAFVLMAPLGLTYFNKAQRKLGRNWKRLHRLIYPAAVLGVIHFFLIIKANAWAEPLLYAATAEGVEGGEYVGPGGFLNMRGSPETQASSDRSRDEDLAARLWAVSETETGVSYDFEGAAAAE